MPTFLQLILVLLTGVVLISTSEAVKDKTGYCRFRGNGHLPPDIYNLYTCAECYFFAHNEWFKSGSKFRRFVGLHNSTIDGDAYPIAMFVVFLVNDSVVYNPQTITDASQVEISFSPANRSDKGLVEAAVGTFLDSQWEKWLSCCESAEICCEEMLSTPTKSKDGATCPRTWDGWACWSDVPAGTTEQVTCPHYIYSALPPSCNFYADKTCLRNGSWFLHPETAAEWTDYSGCGTTKYFLARVYWKVSLHVISAVATIPALFIFQFYRSLRIQLVIMHKNLLLALLFHNIMVILRATILEMGELSNDQQSPSVIAGNGAGCKLLVCLEKYAGTAVYAWMLCEGLYLHRFIVAAFKEQRGLLLFYLIGWALPLLPIISWAIVMALEYDVHCWWAELTDLGYRWITDAPRLAALVLNLIFMIDIVRVLCTKLKIDNSKQSSNVRKAVKATLFLIPVFGLHFLLTVIRPSTEVCTAEQVYYFFHYMSDGIQGLIVAVIYCYLNYEVRVQLMRSYRKLEDRLGISLLGTSDGSRRRGTIPSPSVTQATVVSDGVDGAAATPAAETRDGEIAMSVIQNRPKEADSENPEKKQETTREAIM